MPYYITNIKTTKACRSATLNNHILNMPRLIVIIAALLCCNSAVQTIYAQSAYDLQFVEPTINCLDNQFCTTLQIKAANSDSMALGSHTVFFSFNTNAINFPNYSSVHFDNSETCTVFGISPYIAPAFGVDTISGEANITTLMSYPNMGCPVIDSLNWITMGIVCFDIINALQNTDLAFNTNLTIFNLNNNFPQYAQNTFGNLNTLPICPTSDTDGDGLTDIIELNIGTNLNNADTDGDLLTDGNEVNITLTNPLLMDSNNNGIFDPDEDPDADNMTNMVELQAGTNPNNADSDGDNLNDNDEMAINSNPLDPDTDHDNLNDGYETSIGSNLFNMDSDGDSVPDSIEAANGTAPDTDSDLIANINDPDDDNDNMPTIYEDNNQNGNPTDDDNDQDGIPDYLDPDPVGISPIASQHPYSIVIHHNSVALLGNDNAYPAPSTLKIWATNGALLHSISLHKCDNIALPPLYAALYIITLHHQNGNIMGISKYCAH